MNDNILISTEPYEMDLSASVSGTTQVESAGVAAPADEEPEVNMDEYMERFEKIQQQNEQHRSSLAQLNKLKHAAGPLLGAVIDCLSTLQSQNEEMYNLLVDMNNLFGK